MDRPERRGDPAQEMTGRHLLAQRHGVDAADAGAEEHARGDERQHRHTARKAEAGHRDPAERVRADPADAEAEPSAQPGDHERRGERSERPGRQDVADGAVAVAEVFLHAVDDDVGHARGEEDEQREQDGQGPQDGVPPQEPGSGEELLAHTTAFGFHRGGLVRGP